MDGMQKVAAITGASKGRRRGTRQRLRSGEHRVVATDRSIGPSEDDDVVRGCQPRELYMSEIAEIVGAILYFEPVDFVTDDIPRVDGGQSADHRVDCIVKDGFVAERNSHRDICK